MANVSDGEVPHGAATNLGNVHGDNSGSASRVTAANRNDHVNRNDHSNRNDHANHVNHANHNNQVGPANQNDHANHNDHVNQTAVVAHLARRLRRLVFPALCFAIPVLMLMAVCKLGNVYPFGAQSFLTGDLKYQYVDFFTWYRSVLLGHDSLFYSFAQALGENTWGLFSYYLASPFNLLIVFFDQAHITLFVVVITALKLGCVELAMVYFLRRRFGCSRIMSMTLGLCFTWSVWTVSNLRSTMWLDNLILLPLACLGVYALVHSGKWRLLTATLTISVIVCWYTAYMTICFLVLYLLFELAVARAQGLLARRDNQPGPVAHILSRCIAALAIAMGLSMWTFLPTLIAMRHSAGAVSPHVQEYIDSARSMVNGVISKIPVAALVVVPLAVVALVVGAVLLIRRLMRASVHRQLIAGGLWCFAGAVVVALAVVLSHNGTFMRLWDMATRCDLGTLLRSFFFDGWKEDLSPQLFAGTLVVVLAIVFFLLPAIPSLVKKGAGALLVLMVASTWLIPLEIVWCGFRYPKGFYSRTAVYAVFFMVVLAAMAATAISRARQWSMVARRSVAAVLLAASVAELVFGAGLAFTQLYKDYPQSHHDAYMVAARKQADELQQHDSGVYRFDKNYGRAGLAGLNEGMSTGLMNLSSYSSANDTAAINLLNSLGYGLEGEMLARYAYPSILSDALLGVKYSSVSDGTAGLKRIMEGSGADALAVYENPYALPLGYGVSASAAGKSVEGTNPFERQNFLASVLAGHDVKAYTQVEGTLVSDANGAKTWQVTIPDGALGYAYVSTSGSSSYLLAVDGSQPVEENSRFQHSLRPLSNTSGGTHSVTLTSAAGGDSTDQASCMFGYLDLDQVKSVTDDLASHPFEPQVFEGGHVEGTFTAGSDQMLLMTFPNDAGWKVSVNGKQVKPQSVAGGALMAIPVSEGANRIVMRFTPQGLVYGCVISALTVFATIGYALIVWTRRSNMSRQGNARNNAEQNAGKQPESR
jgi:uncharacterized membrane protein YfhO